MKLHLQKVSPVREDVDLLYVMDENDKVLTTRFWPR
jgi:hypothetical protein